MASSVLPSWEHPGGGNHDDTGFINGSGSHHVEKRTSARLKDPPKNSVSTSDGQGHGYRKMKSAGDDGSNRGEMLRKMPPNPHNRRKSDGDGSRFPFGLGLGGGKNKNKGHKDGGKKVEAFVVDSIPMSPMRTASAKHEVKELEDTAGDSTTCEETKSVSDNSSSLQSPTDREASSQGSVGADRDAFVVDMNQMGGRSSMPDTSYASYPLRPGKVVEDAPIPIHVEGPSRHSRVEDDYFPRRDRADPPPPLAPYEDDYSRSEHYDRYDDDNMSRMSRVSATSGYRDDRSRRPYHDRSRYDDRPRYDGYDPRSRPHYDPDDRSMYDRYDDDNMSRASRGSRYHGGDRSVASSRFPTDRSVGGGRHPGDRSVVSRLDEGSRHSRVSVDMSVSHPSHPSRYEMDKPTRYHTHRPQRYADDDGASRGGRYRHYHGNPGRHHHHHHHHHRHHDEYDDERSRMSRYDDEEPRHSRHSGRRYYEDHYAGSRHSHRYDDYHRRDDGHRYDDRQRRSHHHRGDRYDDDGASRGSRHPHHHHGRRHHGGHDDERSRRSHYDRDDDTIVSSYSRYSEAYPPPSRSSNRRHDREDPYERRRADPYESSRHSRRHDGYEVDAQEWNREDAHVGSRHSRPRDNEYEEDLYEAKLRAFGIQCDTPGGAGVPPVAAAAKSDGGDRQSSEGEVYVDIGFGTKARLRRTKETMEAIERDFYSPATCFACSTDLFCIADVQYIVCPQCKTISPADQAAAGGDGGTATNLNGRPIQRRDVGLGFTYDTLFKMQSDVARGKLKGGGQKVASLY